MLTNDEIYFSAPLIVILVLFFSSTGWYATSERGTWASIVSGITCTVCFLSILFFAHFLSFARPGQPATTKMLLPGVYEILWINEIPPSHHDIKGYDELALVRLVGGHPSDVALVLTKGSKFVVGTCLHKLSSGNDYSMGKCPESQQSDNGRLSPETLKRMFEESGEPISRPQ